MPPIQRDEPYAAHNFQIVVNGVSDDGAAVSGSFSEISGFGREIDIIKYRTGTEALNVRQLPGLNKSPNIVAKRGITGHADFWKWIEKGVNGDVQRAEGSIILNDENQVEVMRWNFSRGWPVKYTGPTLKADANEIAIESLEIAVDALVIDA